MRSLVVAILALSCAAAHAEVYKCPQVYPGKDKPAASLTSAVMTQDADIELAGGFMTDDEGAEEGYDEHYAFSNEWQTRLVCLYGGTKRIKGRFHDGHEWYQHVQGGIEWSMKLPRTTGQCTLQVREVKPRGPGKSMWTATAICKPFELIRD
ncbi:hypothetical protein [Massilia horti]|uniref:Uncharacterized protein n=1 Tax=Massilia horti TaxID=2562153 RepID=A0A4Y9T3Q0_9BURK|nr:hypothetical protein [Massilia horti]TFW34632.1 hypothetical protein E4O92_03470 [Massilia horti]